MKLAPSLALAALALCSSSASAQFTSDASANLPIAAENYAERAPLAAATPDGGFVVGWRDGDPSSNPQNAYDVRVQRYDAGGRAQWAPGGVMVANLSVAKWDEYALAVDDQGQTIVAFRDDRGVGIKLTYNVLDPSGALQFGTPGVWVATGSGPFNDPQVAAAPNGAVYIGWTEADGVRVQRFDANGTPTWAIPYRVLPTNGKLAIEGLVTTSDGGAVAVYSNLVDVFPGILVRQFSAFKLDATGTPAWPGDVQFGGTEDNSAPVLEADDAGGVCLAWTMGNIDFARVFVQRFDANGNGLFGAEGIQPSEKGGIRRSNPDLAFDAADGELFVSWEEQTVSFAEAGAGAQKFDAAGKYMWGREGVTVVKLGADTNQVDIELRGVNGDQGAVVFYNHKAPNWGREARALDDSGAFVGLKATVSRGTGNTLLRCQALTTSMGQHVSVWEEGQGSNIDVFAQNLLPDGSLGGLASAVALDGSGTNPAALAWTEAPALGKTWQLSVDTSSDPAALFSALFVYGRALATPTLLPEGELLVDPHSALVATSVKPAGPAVAAHPFPVPADIAYVGLAVHAQAAILGAGSATLTNGVSATVGL